VFRWGAFGRFVGSALVGASGMYAAFDGPSPAAHRRGPAL